MDWLPSFMSLKDEDESKKIVLQISSINTGAGDIVFQEPITIGYIAKDREGVTCDDSCEFAFDGEVEEMTVYQSEQKTLLISNWIKPDDLSPDEFLEKEHEVMIIHDDIVDYTFDITTKNFDLSKITFLQFASADEIRQSAAELVANYLFYGNEHISPDRDWHRDKGIELQYQPQYGGLRALLEG